MKKTFLPAFLVLVVFATAAPASPVFNPKFNAAPGHHRLGDGVAIRLVNAGTTTITMGQTWDLKWLDGDGTAFYQWPADKLQLKPGAERLWIWDQRVNRCYGECQNVSAGDPAQAGRYEVTTTINGDDSVVTAKFNLGEYFILGFRGRPQAEFTVFVATQDEVDAMRAEAARPMKDKHLITSGIVRGFRRFNPDWKFSMGPRSIVLGEAFIEVCDGSPYYVQRHREEWYGERWCPWGSYVKRVRR